MRDCPYCDITEEYEKSLPKHIDFVFDGPPGPEAGRFVEVEDDKGASIRIGEWVQRDGGHWALRINPRNILSADEIVAAIDPTAPTCDRCGAKVHDPCATDEAQATCQLPDFCYPVRSHG